MSCSLGVNSFRSSAQIIVRQLAKPCGGIQLSSSAPANRCFSLWQSQSRNQSQWLGSRGRGSAAKTSDRGLLPTLRAGARTFRIRKSSTIILTSYLDLPKDYKDEVGLPFRATDLEGDEVVNIFGPYMGTKVGNKLLRILHGRRVAGTLDDPTLQVHTAMYSKNEKRIALDYLRRMVPVDEVLNAGLKAEEDLALLEAEGGAETEGPEAEIRGVTIRKPSEKSGNVYGKGIFDSIREQNMARRAAEQEAARLKEEEQRKKEEEEVAKMTPGELEAYTEKKLGWADRKPSASMQAYIDAAQSDLQAPPEMSKWERILPSAILVVLVAGSLISYAIYYRPLKRSDRLFPDIPPAAATVGVIVLANLVVYAAWKAPRLWPTLNKYFLLVPATPKPWSIFGAMFSHQQFSHVAINMVVLWMIGTAYYDEVGRGDFLATYFTSGSLGFLGTLTWIVLRNQLHLTTLGASGAVYGLTGAYFWMHRFEGFKLLGLPPDPANGVPGMAFIGTIVGLNIAAMFSRSANWDVASHMVGLAAGMVAGYLMERKKEAKRRLLEEQKEEDTTTAVIIPTTPVNKGGS